MKNTLILSFITFTLALSAQSATTLQTLRFQATFHHISCHVDISGDTNLNGEMLIQYKPSAAAEYLAGAETMRAFPSMIVDGGALNRNFHAGSAMFLEADTEYAIRLILCDEDGGGFTRDTIIRTKNYPKVPANATVITVSIADGPGAISEAILAADGATSIMVGDGIYAPFTCEKDSIFLKSENLHGAIIDGGNTATGVITLGNFVDSTGHLIIDGFLIRNGRWGIDAQNTQYLTVQNCDFIDVDYGIINRRDRGWEHDQYFTNNRLSGTTSWPQGNSSIPGERAIDLRGNNHVVSHNTISNFGDGISTDGPPYGRSYSLDIHHNEINRIVDDLIEVDGMISNSRIYSNRVSNGRAGISLAPVLGGPAYVFRNQLVNMEISSYKMNRSPAGLYIVHNTTLQSGNGLVSPPGWRNTVVKNNVVAARRYCFEVFPLVQGTMNKWDHNAYYSTRDNQAGVPWFKWDDTRYNDIAALQAGTDIEDNGIVIELSDIVSDSLPSDPFTEVTGLDLSLVNNSTAKNKGELLPNINRPFVTDGMPDLGFKEVGSMQETYGHNFADVCGGEATTLTWTGTVSTSWSDRRNWSPCGTPSESTTVIIPAGLQRYPSLLGSFKAASLILEEVIR